MTPKQTEVLGWVQKGASNKVIAQRMGINESTVKLHVSKLFKIYAVRTRQQLALYSLSGAIPSMPDLEQEPYAWLKTTDNHTGIAFGKQPDSTWVAVYKKTEK